MLSYYLTWHLKTAWKPLLFTDEHRPVSPDPVAKAVRSPAAQRKAQTKLTTTGEPCHGYQSLLAELATQTRNTNRLTGSSTPSTSSPANRPPSPRARPRAEPAHVT